MSFFSQKRVGELNSRISSDITQIQDTLTSTIAEFFKTAHFNRGRSGTISD
jgi:ABC-type bacteriocin/lantibiotic exporter with double-glycine peptidase domain